MTEGTDVVERPLPTTDVLSQGFWDAAAQHELAAHRCSACGNWVYPPLAGCPVCRGKKMEWVATSGRGRLFSWIVVHATPHPYWRTQTPYLVVEVLLDEQDDLRMKGTMPGADPETLEVGMAVTVGFEEIDGVTLPYWQLAEASPQR